MAFDEFGIAYDEGDFQRKVHEHYRDLIAKEANYWRRMVDNIVVEEVLDHGGIRVLRPILRTFCDGEKIVVTI